MTTERITDRYVFFWNGIYSNWHYCNFNVNGIDYNCAEQYMMAKKARFFNDDEVLNQIMESDLPRDQKNWEEV